MFENFQNERNFSILFTIPKILSMRLKLTKAMQDFYTKTKKITERN